MVGGFFPEKVGERLGWKELLVGCGGEWGGVVLIFPRKSGQEGKLKGGARLPQV